MTAPGAGTRAASPGTPGPVGNIGWRETMLTERKAAILQAVVEGYISTNQPVGSAYIAEAAGLGVSSATVRNEMVALEKAGYLQQPHTSAGRVPTEAGYRFFVDSLALPYELRSAERQQISQFFDRAHGELEQILEDTSGLLAQVTDYAALVVGPEESSTDIRSVQLVRLADRLAIVVAVLGNGAVHKQTIELSGDLDDGDLDVAGRHLTEYVVGTPFGDVRDLPKSGNAAVDELASAAASALAIDAETLGPVYVGGTSSVAAAFDAVETVHSVLAVLEKQYLVVTLIRDVLDRGLTVAIGTETGVEPLNECSLVVAPYEVQGRPVGSIGVLGPTRMDYPQALATVAVVSRRLGDRLSDG